MPTNETPWNERKLGDRKRPVLSLDTWAVFFALLAALLIRAGVIKHIPW